MTEIDNETWLVNELYKINVCQANTFIGHLQPALFLFDEEHQIITLKYPIFEWQKNLHGYLSSFIAEAMQEVAIELAINCFTRTGIPSAESNYVDFVRRISTGDHVMVETAIGRMGENSVSVMSSLYDSEKGKVAAKTKGIYRLSEK